MGDIVALLSEPFAGDDQSPREREEECGEAEVDEIHFFLLSRRGAHAPRRSSARIGTSSTGSASLRSGLLASRTSEARLIRASLRTLHAYPTPIAIHASEPGRYPPSIASSVIAPALD